MANYPTICLGIPAYNASEYLPDLIKAAHQQAIPFSEILVYDDASTDTTCEVAKQLGAKVIQGKVNRGPGFGKNRLLEACNSEWIHFHDSDDLLLPDFTTIADRWISNSADLDVILFSYSVRTYEENRFINNRLIDNDLLTADPIRYCLTEQINTICGLYKTDSVRNVGGYDDSPEVMYNDDCAFHIRLALGGLRFAGDSRIALVDRIRSTSMTSVNGSHLKCARARLQVLSKAKSEKSSHAYKHVIASELWKNARILAALNQWEDLEKAIKEATSLGTKYPPEERPFIQFFSRFFPYHTFLLRSRFVRMRRALIKA